MITALDDSHHFISQGTHRILLADDDVDDCQLFKEALEELGLSFTLTCVYNGEHFITTVKGLPQLPDVIFLDLNMPRKNGFECLCEIKENLLLSHVPVVIISTSFDEKTMIALYEKGATYYLRKPNDFSGLKRMIDKAILLAQKYTDNQPPLEDYILTY